MMHLTTFAALASLALGAFLTAQEKSGQSPAQQEKVEQERKSTAEYVRDLGSDSFKTRTQAERALRGLGAAAVPDLKKAAEDSSEPEVQWRARRLVRQIERGDDNLTRRERDRDRDTTGWRSVPPQGREDIQRRFDELFGDLETDFGVDIPRFRFFQDGFYKDLQQQMQEMQQQMQNLPNLQHLQNLPDGSHGRSMSMQMGPDGVRVEIKSKNDKGEEEVKVYEAPDLQAFRQKYPDVLQEHGLGGALVLGDGWRGLRLDTLPGHRWRLQPFDRDAQDNADADMDTAFAAEPAPVPPPPGKRLGVVVRPEIPAAVRDYLGVDSGLMVDEVQDGTLASAMHIEKGDIVLEIGGRAIASTQDVQDAIGPIAAGKTVEVKVLRRGKEVVLKADKPDEPSPESAPLEKRKAKDGGIR